MVLGRSSAVLVLLVMVMLVSNGLTSGNEDEPEMFKRAAGCGRFGCTPGQMGKRQIKVTLGDEDRRIKKYNVKPLF
jgi:hypothetical protein